MQWTSRRTIHTSFLHELFTQFSLARHYLAISSSISRRLFNLHINSTHSTQRVVTDADVNISLLRSEINSKDTQSRPHEPTMLVTIFPPVIMNFDLDLNLQMWPRLCQVAKYLNQRLFSSNVIVQRHTQPHSGPTARPEPLNHWTGL